MWAERTDLCSVLCAFFKVKIDKLKVSFLLKVSPSNCYFFTRESFAFTSRLDHVSTRTDVCVLIFSLRLGVLLLDLAGAAVTESERMNKCVESGEKSRERECEENLRQTKH